MNEPAIHLAFVDDWELRGNGSGDIEQLQLTPMRRLTEIFEQHSIRGSFNAEVMQQLAFRKASVEEQEFAALADKMGRFGARDVPPRSGRSASCPPSMDWSKVRERKMEPHRRLVDP